MTLDMAASIFVGAELGPVTENMKTAFEHMVAASMSRIRLPLPGLEIFEKTGRAVRGLADHNHFALPDSRDVELRSCTRDESVFLPGDT